MKNNLLLILGLIWFTACTSFKKPLQIPASLNSCVFSESAHRIDSLVSNSNLQFNFDTTNISTLLNQRFSRRSLAIAKDLQMYNLIGEYARLEPKSKNIVPSPELIHLKQELHQLINVAEADVNSILAELACEKMRTLSVANALADYNQKRINRATVAAILVGSAGAIVAGTAALINPDSSNTIQQVSGLIAAVAGGYFSFKAFGTKKKINLFHARNHLQEIWLGNPNSLIYPPSVWNFMIKEFTLQGKTTTGLQIIKNRWLEEESIDPKAKNYEAQVKLLMGNGGVYNGSELQSRLNMLAAVEAEIDLMKYDLKRLQQEILLGYKP